MVAKVLIWWWRERGRHACIPHFDEVIVAAWVVEGARRTLSTTIHAAKSGTDSIGDSELSRHMGGRPDEGLDGLTRHGALTSDFAFGGSDE
jgi:hypothetical protein